MLEFEWSTEGFSSDEDTQLKVDLIFRGWLHDIADYAEKAFERWVPRDSLRTFEAISEGRVNKTPWGFTVEVGIEPIEDLKPGESPDYPLFVHEGTGLYGSRKDWIYPEHGNVMVFQIDGRTVITRQTTGQWPQPYLEAIEEETGVYIESTKGKIAKEIQAVL